MIIERRPVRSGAIAIAADPGGSFSRALVGRRQGDKERRRRSRRSGEGRGGGRSI